MATPTARRRPCVVPDDADGLAPVARRDVVVLPHHVHWSGPAVSYDLDDRQHRVSVYEQVMAEGTAADIAEFVHLGDLLDLWDELFLPQHIRAAWEQWLGENAGTAC